MRRLVVTIMLGLLVCLGAAQQASALPDFYKEFKKKFIDPSQNERFKEAANRTRCNICHLKGKPKRIQNEYGKEIAKLIEGSARQRLADAGDDVRDAEKKKLADELAKAFKQLANKKSPAGDTYGDRLKAGQLPVVVK